MELLKLYGSRLSRRIIETAPQFIKDRGDKFIDYADHGVLEYWLIDPTEQTVEQYQLHGNTYKLLRKMDSGRLKSIAGRGFEISLSALFDEHETQKTLQRMVTTQPTNDTNDTS